MSHTQEWGKSASPTPCLSASLQKAKPGHMYPLCSWGGAHSKYREMAMMTHVYKSGRHRGGEKKKKSVWFYYKQFEKKKTSCGPPPKTSHPCQVTWRFVRVIQQAELSICVAVPCHLLFGALSYVPQSKMHTVQSTTSPGLCLVSSGTSHCNNTTLNTLNKSL